MKTKAEILDTYCEIHGTFLHLQDNNNIIDGDADAVFEAMEAYAKEVAVAFAKDMTNDRLFTYATMDDFFNKFLSEQQSIKQ